MNIKNKKYIGILLLFQLFSCSLYTPNFKMENNCIIKVNKANFTSLVVETENPDEYYLIIQRNFNSGSTKICFDEIPSGYIIIKPDRDTLNIHRIEFKENQIITIINSGGDRASFKAVYKMKNGNLEKYEE